MAVVAQATHTELGQKVAIKVMLPAAMARPDATDRFFREGRALATLRSPHITKVLDTGRLASGEPFLVMEFLEGHDLEQLMVKRGAIGVEESIDYILQACDALSEAHDLGIIDRDIKPGN